MKNPDNPLELLPNSHLPMPHPNSMINLDGKTDRDEGLEFIAEYSLGWVILDVALFIVIVVGNVLVILAVRLTRKLRNVASNLFVMNLAIADLIVGFTLAYHLAFYMNKELGGYKFTCITRFVVAIVGCSSSMFSLIAIAVDRYIGVMHPLQYAQYVTQKNVVITILIVWFISIAISTVPLYWNYFDRGLVCEFQSVVPRYFFPFFMTLCFGEQINQQFQSIRISTAYTFAHSVRTSSFLITPSRIFLSAQFVALISRKIINSGCILAATAFATFVSIGKEEKFSNSISSI